MDPEHAGEVLTPPPADIPQAQSHNPPETVPDIHPSTEGDIPPRQLALVALLLILLFGWRPLISFSREGFVAMSDSVDHAVALIHAQDSALSERIAVVGEGGQALIDHTQDQLASLSSGAQIATGAVSSFFGNFVLWTRTAWNNITAKWHLFLSGSDSNTQALTDAKEELKAQLRTEILNELRASSTLAVGSTTTTTQEGIIIFPKTSVTEAGRLKEEAAIQGIFSDQVMVKSDETGHSGIVRPIFRSGVGEDYLYVMVPVRNQ